MKKATTIVLLIFVAATIVFVVAGDRGDMPSDSGEVATTAIPPAAVELEPPNEDQPIRALQRIDGDRVEAVAGQIAETVADTAAGARSDHKIIAYYFHRTQRCRTCLTMEAYAEQALRDGLSNAMESGAMAWRAVNVEEPGNEHCVEEYELYGSHLVLVDSRDGQVQRSKKLERIWDLVGDESAFKTFVQNEAQAYLAEAP